MGAFPEKRLAKKLDWPKELASSVGYPKVGGISIRIDMLERVYALLRKKRVNGPQKFPTELLSWLGCDRESLKTILKALGYRITEEGIYPPKR